MKKFLQFLFSLGLLVASPLLAASPHDEADIRCLDCHEVLPFEGVSLSFYRDVKEICNNCHTSYPCKKPGKGEGYTHPLEVVPRMSVPDDMMLDRTGRINCISCHFFHDQGKAAIALNPFYLRRSSVKRLCAACHNEI